MFFSSGAREVIVSLRNIAAPSAQGTVELQILPQGQKGAPLITAREPGAQGAMRLHWDGRDTTTGKDAPTGKYLARVRFLRGGAFKPRSSPYSFQGMGKRGLELLALARAETGLPVVTEAMDPARLAQELALLAVKTDITEELDRLAAHVSAARAHLTDGAGVGRKLDFLMQEFMREANTLCSKAQSLTLTRIGLDLKTVIDQMREQVQNIE